MFLCYLYHSSATNGVVLVSDKKVSTCLVDDKELVKMQNITPSTGVYDYKTIFDYYHH